MADLTLSLGGVNFADFEIPDEISAGGGQLLQIHKYAGGQRTIDAYGPDDEPIGWAGIFFDRSAEPRCQQLDAMRKAGVPVSLSWSSFSYLVVIKSFKFKFQRFYQISYEIELEVVDDKTNPATAAPLSTETRIQRGLNAASTLSAAINDSGLTGLMSGISSAANSVSSITGASTSFITGFSAQIGATLGYVTNLADSADALISSVQAIPSGTSPGQVASSLISAATQANQLANCFAMQNTIGVLLKNVNSILG